MVSFLFMIIVTNMKGHLENASTGDRKGGREQGYQRLSLVAKIIDATNGQRPTQGITYDSLLAVLDMGKKTLNSNTGTVHTGYSAMGYSAKLDIVSILCPHFWSHLLICW